MRLGQISVVHFSSRILASAIGFLATLYFARELGADALGFYYVALGIVSWLSVAGTVGVTAGINKRVSEGEDRSVYSIAGAVLVGILTLIVSVVVFVFQDVVDAYVGASVTEFIILVLIVTLVYGVVTAVLRGLHLVHFEAVLTTVRIGLQGITQIGLVTLGLGLAGLFFGYLAGYLLVIGMGALIVVQRLDITSLPAKRHFRQIVDYAKFAWLGGIRGNAYKWTDVIVLGFFVSPALIGIYSIAWNIAMFLSIFTGSLSATLFPEISELSAQEESEAIADLFEASLTFSGLILIPGLVGAATLGPRILKLYGNEFIDGSVILVILVIAALLQSYQTQHTNTLNAVDRPDLAFKVNAVFVAANLSLNVTLIYLYGWIGAAVATALSVTISLAVAHGLLSSLLEYRIPIKELSRQWFAAVVMGAVVYAGVRLEAGLSLLQHNAAVVILLVFIGAGTYFVVLALISPQLRVTIRDNLPDRVGSRL